MPSSPLGVYKPLVLGEVLKAVFPYLKGAAGAIRSP